MQLEVFGEASLKTVLTTQIEGTPNIDLMSYLQSFNLPIASSCQGEGVCEKCILKVNNNKLLSCQHTIKSLMNNTPKIQVEIGYL